MQKAKYKLNDAAVLELEQLDDVESALKTLTVSYNQLRTSVWYRLGKAYFLSADKQYEYNAKAGTIEEVG